MSYDAPDKVIYARDLDGTGSAHICSEGDPGYYEYVRKDESLEAELYEALMEAKRELEAVTEEFMGEDYNSPSLNAALAKARGETQ